MMEKLKMWATDVAATMFREDEKSAIDLLKTGMKAYDASIEVSELAAWTSISRTLLNIYETTARL